MRFPMLGQKLDMRDLDLLDAEMVGGGEGDDLIGGPAEDAVSSGVAAGNRDENALTDAAFYAAHPERQLLTDPKIKSGEKDAIKEWTSLRNDVVRPALSRVRASAPAGSPASIPALAPAPPPPGSNAAVADAAATSMKQNRIAAGALGLVALLGLGAAWKMG